MKKIFLIVAVALVGLAMSSCGSSESAYKKAYEKAQAAQSAGSYMQPNTQQTQPVQVTTVQPAQVATQPVNDYSDIKVRNEAVTLVDGAGLKDYSVVVGSFGMLSNAKSLQQTLSGKGYGAQIAQANVNGKPFYRVIASTHATKMEAAQSRVRLTQEYPDAWLLYNK